MAEVTMASAFEILPAIDLRGGRVVRLMQGDFDRETRYSDDPLAVAKRFAADGARWLHVVDLDGAREGAPRHAAVIEAMVHAVGPSVRVEVAGGLRDDVAVAAALDAGAARVILGTAALRDPGFAGRMVAAYRSDRIAVAVDVRGGQALGDAWATSAVSVDAEAVVQVLAAVGVTTFEVTAIERDGTGTGPDLELYRRLVRLGPGAIVASAGIASPEDISVVRAAGCTGAIIGRALYDGSLSLRTALDAATR